MQALLQQHGILISTSQVLRSKVVNMLLRNREYLLPAPAPRTPTYTSGKCDKCDQTTHATAQCPWYSKTREESLEEGGVTVARWCQMVSGDMRMTPEAYVAAMGRPSTWGGALEIALMSKMFNVRVTVVRGGKVVSTFDCTGGSPDAVFVVHWTGSHYTPHRYTSLK